MRAYVAGSEGAVGIKVVVGKDDMSTLRKYSSKLNGRVYFDEDGEVYDALSARGVPAWIVTDKNRKVLTRFSGVSTGAPMNLLIDDMIDNRLHIGDYM